jgi:hypothetical protein
MKSKNINKEIPSSGFNNDLSKEIDSNIYSKTGKFKRSGHLTD